VARSRFLCNDRGGVGRMQRVAADQPGSRGVIRAVADENDYHFLHVDKVTPAAALPSGGAVTSWRRATDRAFTVFVCSSCAAGPGFSVLTELGESIRRCPHGVLVSAPCLAGKLSCAGHANGRGTMAVLQPCSKDRSPIGLPQWIGPINDLADTEEVRAWIERGDWTVATLPQELQSPLNWLHVTSSRN
jgi:hypothetical protein